MRSDRMSATKVNSFIGGTFRQSTAEDVFVDPVFDPATGETIALLPYSTKEEIDEAVRAARSAFPDWSNVPVPDRAQVMFRFKNLLEEHFEELSLLVVRENGKTLPGARGAVDVLLAHPEVDAISVVGSVGVASYIYATAAANGKRVQALGGAKNHLIVMDDADLERSVTALISSAFGNAGQRCLAGSVAVGVGSVGEELVRELTDQASRLRLGPGAEPETDMGPVIRDERRKELIRYIEEGQEGEATLALDGRGLGPSQGFFLGPTIFDGVTPDMRLWKEELFGPVLSVLRATDIDEALRMLNASAYGNAASIFTSSGHNAREFKRRAEAGMLGGNVGGAAPLAFFPFTGGKSSFFGGLHATGLDGFRFYTKQKVVTSRWWLAPTLDHSQPEGRGH